MQTPNWFDLELGPAMLTMTAEQALAKVAVNTRIIDAVKKALADHDVAAAVPGWAGPSRSQAARSALCAVLSQEA